MRVLWRLQHDDASLDVHTFDLHCRPHAKGLLPLPGSALRMEGEGCATDIISANHLSANHLSANHLGESSRRTAAPMADVYETASGDTPAVRIRPIRSIALSQSDERSHAFDATTHNRDG